MADGNYRSCMSRAYYACYARVTNVLGSTPGVTFKPNREGPNHPGESGTGGIRKWIESHMPDMTQDRREKLSELIGRLYTLRTTVHRF